jgi:two-component system, chemotaxis family, sensor kinase CheA
MAHSAELRRHIDDLALRLALGQDTSSGEWLDAAEEIRREADQESNPRISSAAAAVARALAESGCETAAVVEAMQQLQLAVEQADAAPVETTPPAEDPELIGDFVLEAREHLAAIEAQVLTLERSPSDAEALHSAFRAFHTIKGVAGFLLLPEVQEMAHQVEAVLDRARNGELTITPAAIDVVLQAADYLRRWVAHLERRVAGQSSQPPARDPTLLARVGAICSTEEPERATPDLAVLAEAVEETPAAPAVASPVPAAAETRQAQAMAVKVDTGKLDALVDMAGELVIAESLVRHDEDLSSVKSQRLQRKIAQLARITAELQKTAMAMRLVPVGPLFRRMARLVRDLARQFGKRVELEIAGADIELDRTIVEELADPLMHMVRNALDHGIEEPEERERNGKPATARVVLSGRHQAGQVVIEIADDGRGLDRERIVKKAIERSLIVSADGMSDNEIFNLIFQPGFSTAAEVTNVSGRGVGMDVVRRHVERLRGRIDIRSTPGQGATFTVKLPLTLAIIDGLVVGVGRERYIVPLFAVREMFRPAEDIVWTVRQRCEMALVRGALLPVLRLHRRFGLTPLSEDPRQGVLVVAEVEGQRFCLLVDELIGKQEVVIKSLGEVFAGVAGIAGGAIMGDGRVGLILDLEKLFGDRAIDAAR